MRQKHFTDLVQKMYCVNHKTKHDEGMIISTTRPITPGVGEKPWGWDLEDIMIEVWYHKLYISASFILGLL